MYKPSIHKQKIQYQLIIENIKKKILHILKFKFISVENNRQIYGRKKDKILLVNIIGWKDTHTHQTLNIQITDF